MFLDNFQIIYMGLELYLIRYPVSRREEKYSHMWY